MERNPAPVKSAGLATQSADQAATMSAVLACPKCGARVELLAGIDRLQCPQCRVGVVRPSAEVKAGAKGERKVGSRIGSAVKVPDEEVLPRRVRNYELLEVIGKGGMGVVYRARQV